MNTKEIIKLQNNSSTNIIEIGGSQYDQYIFEFPTRKWFTYCNTKYQVATMFELSIQKRNYISIINSGYIVYVFCTNKKTHVSRFIGSYYYKDIDAFLHLFTVSNELLIKEQFDDRRYHTNYIAKNYDELTICLYDIPYRMYRSDRTVCPMFPKQIEAFQKRIESIAV